MLKKSHFRKSLGNTSMVGNQEFPDDAVAHLFSQLCPELISIAKHFPACPSREGAQTCYLNEHTFPSFGEFSTILRILDVGKFVPPLTEALSKHTKLEMRLPGFPGDREQLAWVPSPNTSHSCTLQHDCSSVSHMPNRF